MSKKQIQHHDYFGRELGIDDCVVFSVRNRFQVGRIQRMGEKKIRIVGYDSVSKNWRTGEAMGDLKYGREVLKVDEKDVLIYLLKKSAQPQT